MEPDRKLWYIIDNKDDDSISNVIGLFDIIDIAKKWIENDDEEHDKLFNHYINKRKEIRQKIHKCECGCDYKFKNKLRHLLTEEHLEYIKKYEEDDYDF